MSVCSTSRSCSKARSSRLRDAVTEAWRWYPQAGDPVNRFFRSALFPLVIIAALVWLALQTLGGGHAKTQKVTYSQVYNQVLQCHVGGTGCDIDEIVFNPNKNALNITYSDGKKGSVH